MIQNYFLPSLRNWQMANRWNKNIMTTWLTGNYIGCRECRITPDWLLIYEISDDTLLLYLTRTGTHSDLFKM